MKRALLLAAAAAAGSFRPAAAGCAPKADEEVVLFSVDGAPAAGGGWDVPVHAWIFEPERGSLGRAALRKSFEKTQGWSGADADERLQSFLVDSKRGERLSLTDGAARFQVGPSAPNGHALSEIRAGSPGGLWRYRVEGCPGDGRVFEGRAFLLPAEGVSVVSDLDDTVKISQVTDRRAMMDNAFARPFRAVPGMAALYQKWAAGGAAFHYVSASPWQLYPALEEFRRKEGFPDGAFYLKTFRWKDETFFDLFQNPAAYKTPVLEKLLARFPRRAFVLVGDDGERDPEIYGELARRHPGRVAGIFIRRTAGISNGARFERAFVGLPPSLWRTFAAPEELAGAGPVSSSAERRP